jgi:hypothetical protein
MIAALSRLLVGEESRQMAGSVDLNVRKSGRVRCSRETRMLSQQRRRQRPAATHLRNQSEAWASALHRHQPDRHL